MNLKKFIKNEKDADVENIACYFDFETLELVCPDEEMGKK